MYMYVSFTDQYCNIFFINKKCWNMFIVSAALLTREIKQ